MDNWFKSKWFVRALSLAFAISLYIFVSVEDNPAQSDMRFFESSSETETLTDVPVEIKVDDDYVVSGVPEFVSATIEGSKTALAKAVRQRNFSVFVDLRNLEAGEHTVDIEYENVSSDLSIFIEPKTVDVTIEKRSSKEFPVSVDLINEDKLPDGYELGEAETDPEKVTVTSSETVIKQIAVVKAFVDVSGADESIENREVPVNVYDKQGNEMRVNVDPESINASVEIDNPSKTVPVSVDTTGKLPEGYKLGSINANPKEIKLYATSDTLSGIDEIKTKPVDLNKIEESGTLTAELALPDDVETANDSEIEVEVEIQQTKDLKDVSISTDHLPDGWDVTFIQPDAAKADITASGKQKDLDELTKSDFELTIDAEDLEEGEHVVPVDISGPEAVTYTSNPKEVTIELSQG